MTDFVYVHPPHVALSRVGSRPVLINAKGGRVAVDERLAFLWQSVHEQSLSEILNDSVLAAETKQQLKAALACLVEAGFLQRVSSHRFPHVEGVGNSNGYEPRSQPDQPQADSHQNTHDKFGTLPREFPHSQQTAPLVSAIIVAWNSRRWLEGCIRSLTTQTLPPYEIIVVDNHSEDDSIAFVRSTFPSIEIASLSARVSLAEAINKGVEGAKGDYYLVLNPDVELEPDAVAHMLSALQNVEGIAAVVPKLRLMWTPAFLNGIGNRVGAFSFGVDNALGHLDLGQFDNWTVVPSACFAAVLIPRQVWQEVGVLDEGYPLYYEDSDWSYRARLLGLKIIAAPKAVVYHAFSSHAPGSSGEQMLAVKVSQVAYGRYRFVQKIVGEKRFRFLASYLFEDFLRVIRFLLRGNFPFLSAYCRAYRQIIADKKAIFQLRHQIQAARKVDDQTLFALQRQMPEPFIWRGMPELTWDIIQRAYLPLILSGKARAMPEFAVDHHPSLLIVSHDVVDEKMAGPGMRYWEMAKALSQDLSVTLAVPNVTTLHDAKVKIVNYQETSPATLQSLVEQNDIALISGYMVEKFPFLKVTATRLIVDLYTPMVLENIHYYLREPMDVQMAANRHGVEVMNQLVRVGDFFICGNERQRDFWLGVLASQGRVNPLNYEADSQLFKLIDIVGMGFPSRPPRHEKPILRGVHPHVPPEAKIVLWGGGLWNWLDPLTLVKAWQQVLAQYPTARLVFLGTRHPNSAVPAHEMAMKTIQLAEQIGEKDKTILFLEWLPYDDREALLLEADVGVTLHPVHAETRFSLRTRVLDYIWAELPTVITEGDVTSDWVREYGIGVVAAEADADDVADAINQVLQRPKESYKASFEPLKKMYTWANVVQPVLNYCLSGGYAPDRKNRSAETNALPPKASALLKLRIVSLLNIWRTQGMKGVLHRLSRYVQWKLSQP